MPIRINLLAEAQALEDQRRRDPVKRMILAGVVLVVLVLFWSSMLLVQTVSAKSDLARLIEDRNSRTNEYRLILDTQSRLDEGTHKLQELHQLATSRFLNGSLLDALQRCTTNDVQLMKLKVSQSYAIVAADSKAKPDADKPASSTKKPEKSVKITEKIVLTLEAKDTSPGGDAYIGFQNKLSSEPYFQDLLEGKGTFRLAFLGAPQTDPEGKTFVLFTLEARLPEKTR